MAFPQNEVEAIGWDWIAAVSVQNKAWFLRQFLPLGQTEFDIKCGVRQDSRQEMLRLFSENCTPSHVIANIKVGNGDCILENKDTHKGHVKLRLKNLTEDKLESELRILKAGQFKYLCGKVVLEDNAENQKKLTYALHCPSFPKSTSEWDSRQRSADWPAADLREKVKKVGCHLIPRHHIQSKDRDLEWQFNFCEAEKLLIENLNDTQLECYTLLKMFYDREFKRPQFLTPAHLKTVLFRTCERLPRKQWRDEKLGDCLMLLLDELLHYLIQNEMPHYFIADNNMIDHIHEDFIWEMQLKICDVRQNPVQFLYSLKRLEIPDFTGIPIKPRPPKEKPKPPGQTTKTGDEDDKQDSSESRTEQPMEEQDFTRISDATEREVLEKTEIQSVIEKVVGLVKEYKFEEAIDTFMEAYGRNVFKRDDGEDPGPLRLLQYFEREIPEKDLTKYYECLVKKFPDDRGIGSMLANMGCYYFAESGRESDEEKKRELIMKAEEAFLCASEKPYFASASRLDYANFLFQTKRFHKALPLIQRVVEDEKDESSNANSYGEFEKVNVDENLQSEIEIREGGISVPSIVYAYYLLVRCLLQTDEEFINRFDEVTKICEQFENCCSKVHDSLKPLSFSMLGYTFIELKLYENALKAFYTALQLKPEYGLAKQNLLFCKTILDSIAESMQIDSPEESAMGDGPPSGRPAEEKSESEDGGLSAKCSELMDTVKRCLAEKDGDTAVAELAQYWVQPPETYGGPSQTMEVFVGLITALTLDQVTDLESMIKESSANETMAGVMTCIGQVYFIRAVKETEQGRKKWLMVKSEEAFSWAEDKSSFTPADRVDFAGFLCHEKRFPEACRHLEQVTTEESQDPKDMNIYTAFHVDIVDEKIQQEIQATEYQIISIPSGVLSHYLLLKCRLEMEPELRERVKDLEQMLYEYEQCCQKVRITNRPVAYAILGYTLLELQMFKRAAAHFQSAVELDKGYTLALENKELCEGMQLSLGMDTDG